MPATMMTLPVKTDRHEPRRRLGLGARVGQGDRDDVGGRVGCAVRRVGVPDVGAVARRRGRCLGRKVARGGVGARDVGPASHRLHRAIGCMARVVGSNLTCPFATTASPATLRQGERADAEHTPHASTRGRAESPIHAHGSRLQRLYTPDSPDG